MLWLRVMTVVWKKDFILQHGLEVNRWLRGRSENDIGVWMGGSTQCEQPGRHEWCGSGLILQNEAFARASLSPLLSVTQLLEGTMSQGWKGHLEVVERSWRFLRKNTQDSRSRGRYRRRDCRGLKTSSSSMGAKSARNQGRLLLRHCPRYYIQG